MTEALTKNINIVQCLANNISIPVILDSEIVEQRKFTLISTINHSGNLNSGQTFPLLGISAMMLQ